MHEHGPDELIGPLRGTAAWWRGMGAQPEPPEDGPPAPITPRKTRRPRDSPAIRQDLVDRVRKEIAAGTSDTDETWEIALDRMLDQMEKDC